MVNKEKIHASIHDATKLLLDAGLTGEEYLLTLQTLVAHALAANDLRVKKIFLANLNADIRARRIEKMKVAGNA